MSASADRPQPPPQVWVDTLARARADLAAGRMHELEDVLCDLDSDVAEIEDEARSQAQRDERDALGQTRGPRMGR